MILAALPFPNISPELFSIELGSFTFALRWYALAYIAGFLLGWRLCTWLIGQPRLWAGQAPPASPRQIEDLLTWLVVGVILGGRLGYVAFYQPGYYVANPWEILKVWQGGMSFHGGFLGVVVATAVFGSYHRLSLPGLADLLALAAPIGLFLGRIANFINGELWGRPTTLPWGVIFPGDAAQACAGLVGPCARHPSQLYEALLEGLLLGTVLLILALRRGWLRTPWAITGTFLVGYGLARGIVEFFRQPDLQFVTEANPIGHALHFNGMGLTMGQLLSLPMILTGAALIWWARKGRADAKTAAGPETP
ncbi:prolipoprotein diacylglyceryl transferase [Aliiroseovarius sp.]|uniref:prolipoprotein diacylglyceryl transferase n=1 Tax=Aliiroseovarius sp. TaxID=1872442 RepID=UPI002603ED2C|nr:prolipoprotein diacylglyceryl transferase [Aliiroseovarius sp.]